MSAKGLFYPRTDLLGDDQEVPHEPLIRPVKIAFSRSEDLLGVGSFGLVFQAQIKKIAFTALKSPKPAARRRRRQSASPSPDNRVPKILSVDNGNGEEDEEEVVVEEPLKEAEMEAAAAAAIAPTVDTSCISLNCQSRSVTKLKVYRKTLCRL